MSKRNELRDYGGNVGKIIRWHDDPPEVYAVIDRVVLGHAGWAHYEVTWVGCAPPWYGNVLSARGGFTVEDAP